MDRKECKKLEAKVKRMEDEHRKKISPLQEEIGKYRSEEHKKRLEKRVGKCGVFLNRSCESKWNVYSKIVDVNDDGVCILKFEKNDRNEIFITVMNEWWVPEYLFKKSVPAGEFNRRLKKILKEVER